MKRFPHWHLAVSLLLLAALLVRYVDLAELALLLTRIHLPWVGSALLYLLVAMGLKVYRWQLLLLTQEVPISFRRSLSLNFIGTFFNYFLPSLAGGDLVKGWLFGKETKKWWEVYSSLIVDRVIGLAALSLLVLSGFLLFGSALAAVPQARPLLVVALGILALGMVGLVTKRIWWPFTVRGLSAYRFWTHIRRAAEILRTYLRWRRIMGISLLLSLGIQLMDVGITYSLGRSLGVDLPIVYFFLLTPLITLASTVPVSFNGLGVREAAYVVLFGSLGVDRTAAVALSLSYYFLNLTLGIVGGVLYLLLPLGRRLAVSPGEIPSPEELIEAERPGHANV